MNEDNGKKKENIFSKLKEDKKGRAKLELLIYFIFFVGIILFAKIDSFIGSRKENIVNKDSFVFSIKDNYEYNINIKYNDDNYIYKGKVLGNTATINFNNGEEIKYYYLMNNKYYELDNDGNYILTTLDEIYPYIEYKYLDINEIKTLIDTSSNDNNVYEVKISDIVLNSDSEEYIIININEENKIVEIDYTNLFKLDKEDVSNVMVTITYTNINNIISLEE